VKVAVTGAGGYVGLNLLAELALDGHDVVAIDRVRPDVPVPGVSWVEADVLDGPAMTRRLADVELVFHLVAVISLKQEDPVAWRVNAEGPVAVGRAALAAGVRRMVNCGSLASFHYHRGEVVDESSPRAIDARLPVYHRSKYAGEVGLLRVVDAGLDALTCNPTGIFGPRDHASRLSRMNAAILDAANGRMPVAVNAPFDMVDVRDVARGFVLAAEKGRTGENYLLGGHRFRLDHAHALAASLTGRRGPLFSLPTRVLSLLQPIADPIARRFGSEDFSPAALENITLAPVVDITKARTELGYDPRPPEDTVRDLVSFFVGEGLLA
jgi:dihydroflavonol-4-reductase